MESYSPAAPICTLLMPLTVEFDNIMPIWILFAWQLAHLILFIIFSFFSLADYCSHFQSFRYWSESLVSEKLYPATSCRSWSDFKSGRCDNNPTNYMGYAAVPALRGVFHIETAAKRNLFQGLNSEILNYVFASFVKRSEIAKFVKKLGYSLWKVFKIKISWNELSSREFYWLGFEDGGC